MNIRGIGVDIEEIGRFRKLPYKSNRAFYKNIFTPVEIKYCLSKANPEQHFAARFAAKEAVIKAVGSSVYRAKDIEVVNYQNGQPSIKLKNPKENKFPTGQAKNLKLKTKVLISISHTKEYAIAFAIWLN